MGTGLSKRLTIVPMHDGLPRGRNPALSSQENPAPPGSGDWSLTLPGSEPACAPSL